jgi:hypothetical protein
MGWTCHCVSRMPFSRLPHMFLDHKRQQQRPQFNHGHGLLRDLKNAWVHLKAWDTLVGDQNLWHAITKQMKVNCNSAGGGYATYAWLDSEKLDQDTEQSLPSPSSYAGVLLGLSSISTPSTVTLPAATLKIARTNPIAHQISLVPPTNPAL